MKMVSLYFTYYFIAIMHERSGMQKFGRMQVPPSQLDNLLHRENSYKRKNSKRKRENRGKDPFKTHIWQMVPATVCLSLWKVNNNCIFNDCAETSHRIYQRALDS